MTVEADTIAIGSDIHSNPFALEAVIEDIEKHGIKTDDIWILGDIIGYNACPNESVKIVRDGNINAVYGNHDVAVLQQKKIDTSNLLLQTVLQYATHFNDIAEEAKMYTASKLSEDSVDFLKTLSFSKRFNHSIGVHARPYRYGDFGFYFANEEDDKIFQREVNKTFETMSEREKCVHHEINVCFVGHSHRPGYIVQEQNKDDHVFIPAVWGDTVYVGDRTKKYIIDVGSIGQPRDRDPQATWVLYNIPEGKVTFKKTPYDIDKIAKANRKVGLHYYITDRLYAGK